MYSSYALPFYDIVLLGFSVWNLSVFFFGWESNESRHKDRSMVSGVQWRKSYTEGSDPFSFWHVRRRIVNGLKKVKGSVRNEKEDDSSNNIICRLLCRFSIGVCVRRTGSPNF